MFTQKTNYYEILNVSPKATRSEIRESYVRLRNTFNTQNQALYSLMNEDEAQAMTQQVEEAYKILNDDNQRRIYDSSLGMALEQVAYQYAQAPKPLSTSNAKINAPAPLDRSQMTGAYVGQSVEIGIAASAFNGEALAPKASPGGIKALGSASTKHVKASSAGATEIIEKMQTVIAQGDIGDGTTFHKLRELAGVSEAEMQDRTKISLDYLRGIETNTFDRLPRTVFVKGFLRSYFKYLGVPNSEPLVNAFAERLDHWQNNRNQRS